MTVNHSRNFVVVAVIHLKLQQLVLICILVFGHPCIDYYAAAAAGSGGGAALNLTFTQPNFSSFSNISTSGSVGFSNATMWLLQEGSTSASTGGDLIGRAAYRQPISFLASTSFNTSFTFQAIGDATAANGSSCPNCGIAFFISPDGSTPPANSSGTNLGLSDGGDGGAFFAVAFDTSKSSGIKLDIGSVENSKAFVDTSSLNTGFYPELYLCNSNVTFTVWISYNASSQITQVWLINSSSVNFDNPPANGQIITQTENLYSSVFTLNSTWYVGFSATNNYNSESPAAARVAIRSWYFSVAESGNNPTSPSKPNLQLIIPVAVVGLVLAFCAAGAAFYFVRRRRSRMNSAADSSSPEITLDFKAVANLQRFSYRDLKSSTHGFDPNSALVGEGGYSKVYRGSLRDGSVIAIKRLKESLGKEAEFASELRIISGIRHRNLLQLQGWAYEKGEAFLVYKFMRNGSLDAYLFGKKKGTLDGDTRLRILQGVAAALEYLHSGLGECILHRDVKAANVMLTEEFQAVLGDFGLARLIKHDAIVTATMVGTPGYVAPEIFMTGKVTDKVDVYSFGILALEVACGSPAINRSSQAEYTYLVEWVARLQSSKNVLQALDSSILITSPHSAHQVEQQWRNVFLLALMCCHPLPASRPDMRYVAQYVQDLLRDPLFPAPKFDASVCEDKEYLHYLTFFAKKNLYTTCSRTFVQPKAHKLLPR